MEWSEQQLEFALKQKQGNASYPEIGRALGLTDKAVHAKLYREGVRSDPSLWTVERVEFLKRRWADGSSAQEIADGTGLRLFA